MTPRRLEGLKKTAANFSGIVPAAGAAYLAGVAAGAGVAVGAGVAALPAVVGAGGVAAAAVCGCAAGLIQQTWTRLLSVSATLGSIWAEKRVRQRKAAC